MLSPFNQEPISNYTPFPEKDITFSLFSISPHTHMEYQHVYHQLLGLLHQHEETTGASKMAPDSNQDAAKGAMKGRSSKKDRHSKINTARGPRDRRMRLSLDIARRFFDLQDLLGYDKASRTVEWLLSNSEAAIEELVRAHNPSTTTDLSCTCEEECGVVSSRSRVRREKVKRVVERASVGRESRMKARERARERTSQKRRLTNVQPSVYDIEQLGGGQMEDPVCTVPWNPSADVFNYQEENNIDVFLDQDEQIAEFQFSGKAWDGFNSFSLSG